MELKEVTKQAEKRKWLARFLQSYKGGKSTSFNESVYDPKVARYFVAVKGGIELGYIRLLTESVRMRKYTGAEFWRAADAYVKPSYRSQGVLAYMIKECVAQHSMMNLKIETNRLIAYKHYYEALGFTYNYAVNEQLSLVFLGEVEEAVKQSVDDACEIQINGFKLHFLDANEIALKVIASEIGGDVRFDLKNQCVTYNFTKPQVKEKGELVELQYIPNEVGMQMAAFGGCNFSHSDILYV